MRDPMWLAFVFAAGSVMGATVVAIIREIRLRRQADRALRELRRRSDYAGDPRRVSSDWMKGHVYQAGQQGDDAA